MRKTLTDRQIAGLKPRGQRYAEPDPALSVHYVRVTTTGAKSYWAVARSPSAKQVWTLIGTPDVMPVTEARNRARVVIQRVKDGLRAVEPAKHSFAAVASEWIKRHVEKKGLRTALEYQRLLNRYILPALGTREFASIKRSHITSLLDQVEDGHGPRQADYCLATVRAICNWYESRNDDYRSPVARGMKRVSAKAAARERILTDDEIRAVWNAAKGPFGGIVKLLLLSAQRLDKVVAMRWADIIDGAWIINTQVREKGNAGELLLPELALSIINAQPLFTSSPYVFAGRGERPFSGFSKAKAILDQRSGVSGWTLHDLRRTARSLMSRAGVSQNDAELVMGHPRPFIVENYDLHSYRDEKRIALAKLATLIDGILNPRDNVIPLAPKSERLEMEGGR
jgi:integrase